MNTNEIAIGPQLLCRPFCLVFVPIHVSCSLDFSYIQYSNVAAKVVRRCLKGDALKNDAAKREVTSIKFAKWEGGKQVGK